MKQSAAVILPGENGWFWHPEHGWLSVAGDFEDNLWLFDPAQDCWFYDVTTGTFVREG